MAKVSVLIPTYNREAYICMAVESVLRQTLKPFEIMVIDDGSTDHTENVLEPFFGQIKYLKTDHIGVSEARNLGLKEAGGDFIAFLDSDDEWLPEKLQRQLDVFEKNPDVGLVCSRAEVIDDGGISLGYYKPQNLKGTTLKNLISENFIVFSSVLIRKSVFDSLNYHFDSSLGGAVDFDLVLRIAKDYKLYYLDDCLVKYRMSQDAITRNLERIYFSRIRILANFRHLISDTELKSLIRDRLKVDYYCLSLEQRKKGKMLASAINYLISKIHI